MPNTVEGIGGIDDADALNSESNRTDLAAEGAWCQDPMEAEEEGIDFVVLVDGANGEIAICWDHVRDMSPLVVARNGAATVSGIGPQEVDTEAQGCESTSLGIPAPRRQKTGSMLLNACNDREAARSRSLAVEAHIGVDYHIWVLLLAFPTVNQSQASAQILHNHWGPLAKRLEDRHKDHDAYLTVSIA